MAAGLLTPGDFDSAAAALARAAADRSAVRIVGGATKRDWGVNSELDSLELHTSRLNATVEHNAGDLTAIFEAGVPLARAQRELAAAGQMLALDPPLSADGADRATIGGVFATADSGPLRHRYGQPRDLVLGVTFALSDGTLAKAGGKVIKNVAGYDLGKLFTGSFGTLGLILQVSVRLHPLALGTATASGFSSSPTALRDAALTLARAPLELEALDVGWQHGRGVLLAQAAGTQAMARATSVAAMLRAGGLDNLDVSEEDGALWARQRAGQRSVEQAIVHVTAPPSDLARVLAAVERCGAGLVGRAALGVSYVEVDPHAISALRAHLPDRAISTVLDLPWYARSGVDPRPAGDGALFELTRRVKQQFDPACICNAGVLVGGI